MPARDYTRLFSSGKQLVRRSSDGSLDPKEIEDSFRQVEQFVNNTGRSAGVTSNIAAPLSTAGLLTDLPAEIKQWDYFQFLTPSTVVGMMTLRDPGIYLITANVLFNHLFSTIAGSVIAAGVSTSGSISDSPISQADVSSGSSVILNLVSQSIVTTPPVTMKIQAGYVVGSTAATAQLSNWAVTRLFPFPSNR